MCLLQTARKIMVHRAALTPSTFALGGINAAQRGILADTSRHAATTSLLRVLTTVVRFVVREPFASLELAAATTGTLDL